MRQVSRRPALDLVNSMAPVLLAYSALLFVSATTPMVDGIAMLLHAADPGHGGCWPPCAAEVGIGRCAQGAMGPPTEGRSRLRARAHGFLAEGGAQQVRTSAQRWRGSCVSNGNVCIWELPIFIETENRKAATRIVVECSPCKARAVVVLSLVGYFTSLVQSAFVGAIIAQQGAHSQRCVANGPSLYPVL